MRPPEGLHIEKIPSDHPDFARFKVTATSIVHRCPIGDSGVTPCCERTPFELPRWHRITLDDALVTSGSGAQEATDGQMRRLIKRYGASAVEESFYLTLNEIGDEWPAAVDGEDV